MKRVRTSCETCCHSSSGVRKVTMETVLVDTRQQQAVAREMLLLVLLLLLLPPHQQQLLVFIRPRSLERCLAEHWRTSVMTTACLLNNSRSVTLTLVYCYTLVLNISTQYVTLGLPLQPNTVHQCSMKLLIINQSIKSSVNKINKKKLMHGDERVTWMWCACDVDIAAVPDGQGAQYPRHIPQMCGRTAMPGHPSTDGPRPWWQLL